MLELSEALCADLFCYKIQSRRRYCMALYIGRRLSIDLDMFSVKPFAV